VNQSRKKWWVKKVSQRLRNRYQNEAGEETSTSVFGDGRISTLLCRPDPTRDGAHARVARAMAAQRAYITRCSGRLVRFGASGAAKFPKIGDSLPRMPTNRTTKFDAASFIFGGEIRNRTNKQTACVDKKGTDSRDKVKHKTDVTPAILSHNFVAQLYRVPKSQVWHYVSCNSLSVAQLCATLSPECCEHWLRGRWTRMRL